MQGISIISAILKEFSVQSYGPLALGVYASRPKVPEYSQSQCWERNPRYWFMIADKL